MRTLVLLVVLLTGCFRLTPPQPLPDESVAEAFDVAQNSVLALLRSEDDLDAYCSAVWVDDTHALTAAHCVDDVAVGGAVRVGIRQNYEAEDNLWVTSYPMLLVRSDVENDVALLRWNASFVPPSHTALPLLDREPILGERIFAFGHPYGFGYHFAEGRVTHPRRNSSIFGLPFTQHNAYTIPGMSGGPVTTYQGQLMCLNSFYIGTGRSGSPVSGCTHISSIRSILTPVEEK